MSDTVEDEEQYLLEIEIEDTEQKLRDYKDRFKEHRDKTDRLRGKCNFYRAKLQKLLEMEEVVFTYDGKVVHFGCYNRDKDNYHYPP